VRILHSKAKSGTLVDRVTQVLPEGSVLGNRYVIEGRLGDGAMGTVYKAKHVKFTRYFAIKVLHKHLIENPKQVRRFEREAELAGRLSHTNVASVVDVGTTDEGMRYMAMEFAPGQALCDLIDGAMAESRVIDLAKQICSGLQHAHDHGLIHRDLKPENVIIEHVRGGREVVRIVDWGVAILREHAAMIDGDRLTTKGIVVGTPHYMAPEQASGDALDPRVDLFALGLICYERLTGLLPFEGSGVDVARANLQMPTPPMSTRVPGLRVDPVLEAIVRRLLEKHPSKRPPTANAVRELFELYERDRGAAAHLLGVEGKYRVKMPALTEDAPAVRAHSPSQNEPKPEPPPEPQHTTVLTTRSTWKRYVALSLLFSSALALLLYIALRADKRAAPAPVVATIDAAVSVTPDAGTQVAVAQIDAGAVANAPTAASRPTTVTTRPAPIVVGSAPAITVAPPPAAAPPPPPPPPPVAGEPPSGAEVSRLYADVGRELRELEDKKGMDATIDLWPRYRWIRLHEWITTPERRARASEMLERLRRDIAAQR